MRPFLYGVIATALFAIATEGAQAQTTYTTEDTLTGLMLGVGAILFAFGFMSGKQR